MTRGKCIGKDPEQLEGFVVLFASSEVAGALGYETPACLLLRRLCARTPALAQALFGSSVLPTLVQYNPVDYFLQVENGEILLTGLNRFVGYWHKEWHGELIYEIGWGVLPAYQGRGIAARATALALDRAGSDGRHRYVHAFPSVENAASNAICRKVGFTLLGEADFEYPQGHPMRCNDWRCDVARRVAR